MWRFRGCRPVPRADFFSGLCPEPYKPLKRLDRNFKILCSCPQAMPMVVIARGHLIFLFFFSVMCSMFAFCRKKTKRETKIKSSSPKPYSWRGDEEAQSILKFSGMDAFSKASKRANSISLTHRGMRTASAVEGILHAGKSILTFLSHSPSVAYGASSLPEGAFFFPEICE